MPNRIIKESTFTSDRIAALTDFEFRLWVGLITQADDAGRGDARPAIIKGRVFALRERTTASDIDKALHALAAHGCVVLYTVDGKPYYEFPSWSQHQRIREAKSKYPSRGDSPQLAATRGETPPKSNPIQSESKSESESKSDARGGARARAREAGDPFIAFATGRGDLMEALDGYAEMRRNAGRPLTDQAMRLLIEKLEVFPEKEHVAIVNQATERGWMSFYAIDRAKDKKPARPARPASYDLEKAEHDMKCNLPTTLKKKGRNGNGESVDQG